MILSDTSCTLGEGALWHPEEQALYWFDILGKRLYRHDGRRQQSWPFDTHVSAAGWIDPGRLLIAGEGGLFAFETETGAREEIAAIEPDRPEMRPNDGRADPWGGFWISTMRKDKSGADGAIYRFYQGEVTQLYADLEIPNAISFAPGGAYAYFCDTRARIIRRVALDGEGWPAGKPREFVDLRDEGLNPDGAVVDSQGNLWNAQFGAGRVACYTPDGAFMTAIGLPAGQVTCPAFGGPDLSVLYVTSAADGAGKDDRLSGATFAVPTGFKGQRAHRVVL
ncbi:L-arabinolactonase [Roseivivax sp. THAF40]|uniref:SMP-30/gluconolactonase/LRE family protein n=1 Tax=unclassified Roseivivax TaxID=2639302 RepID=UPI00126967DA|nr:MULTISPECIES: SMP-30/gluconolactonase/LRE family protein [unclassified Roseivivax]QFS83107.1 L-arabinolactonase [Roseivivax sp. THAF197b]QFT46851.1 L-arabinolactonase [Roseivivax sp. THAF40]